MSNSHYDNNPSLQFSHQQPKIDEKFLSSVFKQINPDLSEERCMWAALQTAKGLLQIKKGKINEMNLIDIGRVENDDKQYKNFKSYLKQDNEKEKIIVINKEKFFDQLKSQKNETVMIIESGEGHHYYNIFKERNGNLWLVDSDRQVYFQINSEDDFIHPIKGWRKEGENTKFDYFYCEFTDLIDKDEYSVIKIHVMSDHFLDITFNLPMQKDWTLK